MSEIDALQRSLIAYFDILGYADYVQKLKNPEEEQEFFNIINECVKKVYGEIHASFYFIEEMYSNYPLFSFSHRKFEYKIKGFSDNFIIAIPLLSIPSGIVEKYIMMFFSLLFEIQSNLIIRYSLFIRGAVVIDDIYISDEFVYGKGLIKAYNLENTIAIYPRIVIDQEVIYEFKINDFYGNLYDIFGKFYKQDFDRIKFLNYMNSSIKINGIPSNYYSEFVWGKNIRGEKIIDHKKAIIDKLNQYYKNPKILQKYLWVLNYHNSYILENKDEIPEYEKYLIKKTDLCDYFASFDI